MVKKDRTHANLSDRAGNLPECLRNGPEGSHDRNIDSSHVSGEARDDTADGRGVVEGNRSTGNVAKEVSVDISPSPQVDFDVEEEGHSGNDDVGEVQRAVDENI